MKFGPFATKLNQMHLVWDTIGPTLGQIHRSVWLESGKKSITILQLYNASGLQSTNLIVLKSDNNLQVLTPFHLQSTTKFWYKSTIYI